MQAKIRHNAEELSSYLSEISRWEKDIHEKDKSMSISKSKKPLPTRSGSGTVLLTSSNHTPQNTSQNTGQSAASHTYDVGYKRWETFDPDNCEVVDSEISKCASKINITPVIII